ncbi:MAG: penicillin-binding transpeptidase domain-containing protein [Flavobacteriaceae bacterium]|nr:penicillin-binding transpeptidase domain-containing protein [Flavobacteriaceae bacterium]
MNEKKLLSVVTGIVAIVFTFQLFNLQILNTWGSNYSQTVFISNEEVLPGRGQIFDRNGNLLVSNRVIYNLMLIPDNLKEIDTVEFASILGLTKNELVNQIKNALDYSSFLPSQIKTKISDSASLVLHEKIWKYPGFFLEKELVRDYKTESAYNLLGYINEVTPAEINQDNSYYSLGDLIGRSGIEKQYELELRGKKGIRYFLRDKFNRDIGGYSDGRMDVPAQSANDLVLSIDSDIQEYGHNLMNNKRGGIVAIEPNSGGVLALISKPSFNSDSLQRTYDTNYFNSLIRDTLNRPFFNRALQAQYSPGSPFKTLNGLIGLQEKVIDSASHFVCNRGYRYAPGSYLACRCPLGTRNKIVESIRKSCNSYFAQLFSLLVDSEKTPELGVEKWRNHLISFGLGDYLGYDLPIGSPGFVPDGDYYSNFYGDYRWNASSIISNAIGQGEIVTTPIQMANFTAAIANRGFFYRPHFVKKIGDTPTQINYPRQYTTIDSTNFEPVISGMEQAVLWGTSTIARIENIQVCGKTGTVENFILIDGKKTQLTDHSVFIAFAPKEDPEIAICVYIENGYWSSRWAAPIASLMIERYLTGGTTRSYLEKRMLEGSLLEEYKKPLLGDSFSINQ